MRSPSARYCAHQQHHVVVRAGYLRPVEPAARQTRRPRSAVAWRGCIVATVYEMDRRQLRSLRRVVEETLVHTSERDLRNATLWHLSIRAGAHALAGQRSAAREDAQEVLASGACEGLIWSPLALALTALRVGDEDASPHLDGAWRLAVAIQEPASPAADRRARVDLDQGRRAPRVGDPVQARPVQPPGASRARRRARPGLSGTRSSAVPALPRVRRRLAVLDHAAEARQRPTRVRPCRAGSGGSR